MSPWESHFGKTTALLLPDAVDASPFLSEDTMNVQRAVAGAVAEEVDEAEEGVVSGAGCGAVERGVSGAVEEAWEGEKWVEW